MGVYVSVALVWIAIGSRQTDAMGNCQMIWNAVLICAKGVIIALLFGLGIATLMHNLGYHSEAAGVGFAGFILMGALLLYRIWFMK